MKNISIFIILALQVYSSLGYRYEIYYNGPYGVDHWGEIFPQCSESNQSPININMRETPTVPIETDSFLTFANFEKILGDVLLANVDNKIALVLLKDYDLPEMYGGPFGDDHYIFSYMQFHWAPKSEHYLNNRSLVMNADLVFYKQSYGSLENALNHTDGIATIILFYSFSLSDRASYNRIIDKVGDIMESQTSITYSIENIGLSSLMPPRNLYEYYSYIGSLTNPPCSPGVRYIIFNQYVLIGPRQFSRMTVIKDEAGKTVSLNSRPLQDSNGRVLEYYEGVEYAPIWEE